MTLIFKIEYIIFFGFPLHLFLKTMEKIKIIQKKK
jgi:hypothetical protein